MKHLEQELEIIQSITVELLVKTETILKAIKDEDLEFIAQELDQRDRAIKVLEILTCKFPTDYLSREYPDFNRIISKVRDMDDEITLNLCKLKESLHLEIAKTFKTKENLNGYNLNNIK